MKTYKIDLRKFLLTIAILALSLTTFAQTVYHDSTTANNPMTRYDPVWRVFVSDKKDTVACDILVSVGSTVTVIRGYYVAYAFRSTSYKEIIYLDAGKRKLPKEVKVWMSHAK